MKNWIVYVTPENKTEAVELTNSYIQRQELTRQNCVIIGYPAFKRKQDAIDYCEQIWDGDFK